MVDERLLTAAKLQEIARGNMASELDIHEHFIVQDETDRAALSFAEEALDGPLRDTELGKAVLPALNTQEAGNALHDGVVDVLSAAVGVTEQDLEANQITLTGKILAELENDGAPTFSLLAGNPNTGKTGLLFLLAELRRPMFEDYLVLSNVRSSTTTDIVVTSTHELLCELIKHRDVPKFVGLDEGSTFLDARTYSHQVATQFTPLAKRFAKLGVDVFASSIHTGKDAHPEAKRLSTFPAFKYETKQVAFFEKWDPEADFPEGQLFGGDLHELEDTADDYEPDDAAPWKWDLREQQFAMDLSWPERLDWLRDNGPAEE